MLHAMSDALVAVLRTHEPSQLRVHDRSSTGYAVTYAEQSVDPGSGQVTTEIPLTRDLEITREEAAFLVSQGALWTGRAGGEPR
jgi:hypothetical protein